MTGREPTRLSRAEERRQMRLVIGAVLGKRKPRKEDFHWILFAFGGRALRRWRKQVEQCYERLKPEDQDELRPDMFCFYWDQRDYRNAERFVSLDVPCVWNVDGQMEAYLDLGRVKKAKELVRWCREHLELWKGDTRQNILRLALAKYCIHLGDLNAAQRLLQRVEHSDCPSSDDARCALVDVQAAILLSNAQLILREVEQAKNVSAKRLRQVVQVLGGLVCDDVGQGKKLLPVKALRKANEARR